MHPVLCDFDELPLHEVGPGLSRRHISGEGATFAYLVLSKGAVVPEHHHPNEQITYIPKGCVRVTTPSGEFIVSSGQVLVIPPNVPHRFEALEDTVDIDVFSPPRRDFEG